MWRQLCFSVTVKFLRASFTSCSLHTTPRNTCRERWPTALAYTENLKPASFKENFPTQSWERKANDPWLCDPPITPQAFEFTWIAKLCFHTLLSWMLRCDQMQRLQFKLWVLKSCFNCFKSCVPFFVFAPSPSHRRCPVALAWRTFSPSFQPNCLEIPEGSGPHKGQDDTVTTISRILHPPPPRPSKVSPLQLLRRWQLSPSPCRRVWAAVPSLLHPPPASSSLARFLSSSTPSYALTLVVGWFLTVSLLLLSHSGASVVAVENGYPCLFFFVITQIKIPTN